MAVRLRAVLLRELVGALPLNPGGSPLGLVQDSPDTDQLIRVAQELADESSDSKLEEETRLLVQLVGQ